MANNNNHSSLAIDMPNIRFESETVTQQTTHKNPQNDHTEPDNAKNDIHVTNGNNDYDAALHMDVSDFGSKVLNLFNHINHSRFLILLKGFPIGIGYPEDADTRIGSTARTEITSNKSQK